MIEHVTAWLGAYHDGELGGRRSRQVEAHMADCASCRAELESLRALTALLQESPVPVGLMPAERFVAQVGLRLPRRPVQPAWRRALEVGWRLTPAGLLGAWAFIQAVFVVSRAVLVALELVLGGSVTVALRAGFLGIGAFGWFWVFNLALSGAIGLLLWSWLASWWARRQQRPGPIKARLARTE